MGTNFYLRKRISDRDKLIIIDKILNNDYKSAIQMIPSDIHIGKRSGGWRFHWDHNYFNYYRPNKESLIEWLHSGIILDEYGEIFTFDQFWDEEVGNCLTKGWDMQSYADEHGPSNYWDPYSRKQELLRRCPELENIEFTNQGDFYIDGLRYSVLTDYS
jgi:hypothetical protein